MTAPNKGLTNIEYYGSEKAAVIAKKKSEAAIRFVKEHNHPQAGISKIDLLGPEKYETYIQHKKEAWIEFADRRLATYRATIDKRWTETPPAERREQRYEHWRQFCLNRDGNTCYLCDTKEEDIPKGKKTADSHLHVHHIRQWHKFEESRFDTNNGVSLCPKCHRKEHRLMKQGKTLISILPSGESNIIPEIELVNGKRIFSLEHCKKLSNAAKKRGNNGNTSLGASKDKQLAILLANEILSGEYVYEVA